MHAEKDLVEALAAKNVSIEQCLARAADVSIKITSRRGIPACQAYSDLFGQFKFDFHTGCSFLHNICFPNADKPLKAEVCCT